MNSDLSVYLLLRTNLPSNPPNPFVKVVADDAELPYLRGVAKMEEIKQGIFL